MQTPNKLYFISFDGNARPVFAYPNAVKASCPPYLYQVWNASEGFGRFDLLDGLSDPMPKRLVSKSTQIPFEAPPKRWQTGFLRRFLPATACNGPPMLIAFR